MNTKTILILAVLAGVAWLIYRGQRQGDSAPMINTQQDAKLQMGGGGGGGLGGLDVFGMLGM